MILYLPMSEKGPTVEATAVKTISPSISPKAGSPASARRSKFRDSVSTVDWSSIEADHSSVFVPGLNPNASLNFPANGEMDIAINPLFSVAGTGSRTSSPSPGQSPKTSPKLTVGKDQRQ
jgi:hypothetical protein